MEKNIELEINKYSIFKNFHLERLDTLES